MKTIRLEGDGIELEFAVCKPLADAMAAQLLGETICLSWYDQAKDQDQSLKDRLAALAVEKGSLKLGKAELKVSPPHSIEIKDLNPFIISIAAPKSIFVNLGAARERLDLRSPGDRQYSR